MKSASPVRAPIAVYRDIAELPGDAREILDAYAGDLCLTADWFDLLRRHCLEGGELRIYAVHSSGGTTECLLFTMSVPTRGGARKLRSLTNSYTLQFSPLMRPGIADPAAALDALASFLASERPAWDIVEFRGLSDGDATTPLLLDALRRARLITGTYFQYENWFCPTAGLSSAAYFATRSAQLRNTVTRKSKKVRKEHDVSLRLFRTPDEVAEGIEHYEWVYARSWKTGEAYPEFIRELLRRAAEQGTLRLGVLYLDGRPAAAQMWFVLGGRAIIYKLAYDEADAALSVGTILSKFMFDHALDVDKVSEIDYGIGSEPYKREWMTACRGVIGIIGFKRSSIIGLAGATAHFAGRLRQRLRDAQGAWAARWRRDTAEAAGDAAGEAGAARSQPPGSAKGVVP